MSLFYRISIDRVNGNYVSGWCCPRFGTGRPVDLLCRVAGETVAAVRAELRREDLYELGLHPTGVCGFEFVLATDLEDRAGRKLEIIVRGPGTVVAEIDLSTGAVSYPAGWLARFRDLFAGRGRIATPVVFMHIPKTAGTSFNTLVQTMIAPRRTVAHIELLDPNLYGTLADSHDFISGHLRAGELKRHFRERKVDFYTIVREPFGQLHSHIRWLIETAADGRGAFFRQTNPVIFDLGRRLGAVDFSSPEALAAFVSGMNDLEAAFLDNMQTRYFLDRQPARVGVAELDEALANMSLFKLIGRTEDYSAFVAEFSRLSGFPSPRRPIAALNIARSAALFDHRDEAVRHALEPLVRADLRLCEAVRQSADAG